MKDVFYRDKEEYKDKLNPFKFYLEQLTTYVQVKKQLPKDKATVIARKIFDDNFQDKTVKHFSRKDNGDREVLETPLSVYIKSSIDRNDVIAPTFTTYTSADIERSVLLDYVDNNVKNRAKNKAAAHKAKALGDMELFTAKNNEQNNDKRYNNSLSGIFSQKSSVMHNPTAHSTLTSITRIITSLSNANNESLIAGNRYLPRAEDILNHIVYISTYADIEAIKKATEKFNLHIPTVDEVVSVLKYSSDLYNISTNYYRKNIIPFLSNLNGYQLAAIAYTNDLYHLRVYNSNIVRSFIGEVIQPIRTDKPLEDLGVIKTIEEPILNFVHCILYDDLKGKGKDYKVLNETPLLSDIYHTSLHVAEVVKKYSDIFIAFLMTSIFPNNSFRLKNMLRRVVVLSDTDSTCFTMDEWVEWYLGEFKITNESVALSGILTYIASQTIVDKLSRFSKYMGVDTPQLNTLSMKNEFLWTIHVPTNLSKHYFANTVMQEGAVFNKPSVELKGVHLKSSAVPINVINHGKDVIDYILTNVNDNKKISLNKIIDDIKNLELSIIDNVKNGNGNYLRKTTVKDKEAYSQSEDKSNYRIHTFWNETFGLKYGAMPNPPYSVLKLPTILVNQTAVKSWLDNMEDKKLSAAIGNWFRITSRKEMPTMYVNQDYLLDKGVPIEILDVVDVRRIVLDTTIQQRVILESLGLVLNSELMIHEQL